MKKSWLFAFLLFSAINLVAAQGTITDLLQNVDEATVLFFAIFLISFSLLFFALNKIFKKQNTTVSGIIAGSISLLLVYWVNKSGFSVGDSLSEIGIASETLGVILPIVIIAGIVFLVIKMAKNSLLVVGGLLVLLSFFVYARLLLIVVGTILIVVRFFIPKNAWNPPEKSKGYLDRGAGI